MHLWNSSSQYKKEPLLDARVVVRARDRAAQIIATVHARECEDPTFLQAILEEHRILTDHDGPHLLCALGVAPKPAPTDAPVFKGEVAGIVKCRARLSTTTTADHNNAGRHDNANKDGKQAEGRADARHHKS